MVEIEFKNVSFSYNDDTPVLEDINLTFGEPGLTCIIGPNGVGKSTLVKCLNNINPVTGGVVLFNGVDINTIPQKDIAKVVGFVPVRSNDLFSMNVIDTILIGRHNHSKWKTTEKDLEVVHKVMKLLKIEDLAMRSFNELSAGQHQKVAIARGLVQEPEMLILDEPTSNLDVRHQVYVTELLRAIAAKKGMSIVMISHDLNISAKYAHKIIVMEQPGVVNIVGTPEEIIEEKRVETVYGVRCKITSNDNKPHVMLGSSLSDEEYSMAKQD